MDNAHTAQIRQRLSSHAAHGVPSDLDLWSRIRSQARPRVTRPPLRFGLASLLLAVVAALGATAYVAGPAIIERFWGAESTVDLLPPEGPTLLDHAEMAVGVRVPGRESSPFVQVESLEVIAAGTDDDRLVILATGLDPEGVPRLYLGLLEPEPDNPLCVAEWPARSDPDGTCPLDKTFDWRPYGGGSGPVEEDGLTSMSLGGPEGITYVGFLNADPNRTISFEGLQGQRQSIAIEAPEGILVLRNAPTDLELRQP